MNTTAITICITSITQEKGGQENYVRLDFEYPVFRGPGPKNLSVLSCYDTLKNLHELGTVPNRGEA